MKRCVVVQMYGLGNSVLATPLIQAVKQVGYAVDVLVEHGRAAHLAVQDWPEVVDNVWLGSTPPDVTHDLALFCHPSANFLSRVRAHVTDDIRITANAKGYSWAFTDHEVHCLMAMARRHGWSGDEIPPLRVPKPDRVPAIRKPAVALGIGYLKEARWRGKHWGNTRFAALAQQLHRQGVLPIIVGSHEDHLDAQEIERGAPVVLDTCGKLEFTQTVGLLAECAAYVGNDSGLMHVAAAVDIPTVGIFLTTNPVKNAPWCDRSVVLLDPTIETVVDEALRWATLPEA